MPRSIFYLILIALACLAGNLNGQAAKGITIRVFAAALHPGQDPVCALTGEVRGDAFELPEFNLSDFFAVPARDFRLISAASPLETPPQILANIRLPGTGTDFRILLVPAADATYQAVVIRGDDPMFSSGDVFFINLSSHRILGRLGSTQLDLKSNSREIIRLPGKQSGTFFEVKFAREEAGKLLPLTDTRWPVLRNNRSFLIFHNGKRGLPTYRAVDEFLDPASAAQ
jgi:hypothetical protein